VALEEAGRPVVSMSLARLVALEAQAAMVVALELKIAP
jgi:hypothetical protein